MTPNIQVVLQPFFICRRRILKNFTLNIIWVFTVNLSDHLVSVGVQCKRLPKQLSNVFKYYEEKIHILHNEPVSFFVL